MSDYTEQAIRWLVRDCRQRGYEMAGCLAEAQKHYGYTTSVWGTVVDEIEKEKNFE